MCQSTPSQISHFLPHEVLWLEVGRLQLHPICAPEMYATCNEKMLLLLVLHVPTHIGTTVSPFQYAVHMWSCLLRCFIHLPCLIPMPHFLSMLHTPWSCLLRHFICLPYLMSAHLSFNTSDMPQCILIFTFIELNQSCIINYQLMLMLGAELTYRVSLSSPLPEFIINTFNRFVYK